MSDSSPEVASADAATGDQQPRAPLTVPAILRAAADLIEPKGRWTQGWFAKDAIGKTVSAWSDEAACFCAAGAINRLAPRDDHRLLHAAHAALSRAVGPCKSLGDWNDAPFRRQAEVVAALRKAADLAEADGAREAASTTDANSASGMNNQ